MIKNRRMALWLGSLLVAAAMLARLGAAADNAPADAPASGQLLIAAATIQDPRFYHGVILLVRCDAKGAFGIMINRPLGERPIADLLAGDDAAKDRDGKTAPAGGMIRVFLGGPVEPQYGFVIHSTDYRSAATVAVADGIAMTATRAILRDIVRHRGPRQYRFAIGYSGWSAGQLDGEIARRDWFVAPATPDLVFDADTDRIWRTALSRRTQEL